MVLGWMRGSQPPPSARLVGHVTAVKLYPVKSLGGMALSEAECTTSGLKAAGLQLCDRYSLHSVYCSIMLALGYCYVRVGHAFDAVDFCRLDYSDKIAKPCSRLSTVRG